jgi:histidine triad (HIT) family protein
MSTCLFCRIVAGEIPSIEVASSEHAYAFDDLNPMGPTHVLVVPRRHITDAGTVEAGDGEALASMFLLAQEVARRRGLDGGYRLILNVGIDSGNSVPHLHLHVIGGRPLGWPPG